MMIEVTIITVLVLWSCVVVFNKLMPKTANKTYAGLSGFCERQGWFSLANKLRPKNISACGGGCGCDASTEQPKQEIKTVKWK